MSVLLGRTFFFLEFLFSGCFIVLKILMDHTEVLKYFDDSSLLLVLEYFAYSIPFVLGLILIFNFCQIKSIDYFFRQHIFSLMTYIPMLLILGDVKFTYYLTILHLSASFFLVYKQNVKNTGRELEQTGVWEKMKIKPAQLVLFSFVSVIMVGSLILMLPIASVTGKSLNFLDALFMATSATCVTGLSTVSLSTDFSMFGQIVILIMIQIGGLSIMTLYSSMVILLGRSIRMNDRLILQDLMNVSGMDELFNLIRDIIKYTFIIEIWGGIILTVGFMQVSMDGGVDMELNQAIYYGFFHSISAFCNAGFSLFNNSLVNYATTPMINGTIIILVTLGGLGFIVIKDLKDLVIKKQTWVRMALHSKVVIVVSIALTLTGTIFIFFSEFLHSLNGYTLFEKLQISLFQSVTLRTSGFNTIPLTNLAPYTLYGMTLFMFIGGSPGSTAGGLKTTTLAILVESIKTTLFGKKDVLILDRKIPSHLIVKATALAMISILIACAFMLLLIRFEPNQAFSTIFFEIISASGTVGLSLGMTPTLSSFGKVAISILMLIGRIGPLTLVFAIGQKNISSGTLDYPNARIMIG